jgi:group I intron endonuclease
MLESSLSLRKFYSTKYNPDPVVPILKYENADLSKKKAVKENKGRSGVYLWKKNITGKCYVGSSVFLGRRLKNYFSFEYIANPKSNMLINKALIKYGYSNFSLEIIEYCEPSLVVTREQYYIDLLKPEYNILKVAGSSLGYKHTEESRSKMGGIRSPEHLDKILSNLRKINLEGFSPEVRARITQGIVNFNIKTKAKGKKVVFINIETP